MLVCLQWWDLVVYAGLAELSHWIIIPALYLIYEKQNIIFKSLLNKWNERAILKKTESELTFLRTIWPTELQNPFFKQK